MRCVPETTTSSKCLCLLITAVLVLASAGWSAAWAAPWTFGILSDTQWRMENDGQSPNTIPAGIIKQIDREFIRHRVPFVVAVGDTVNKSSKENLNARARYTQGLYNAGIGFFPLRGNHDAGWEGSASEFAASFPQIRDGVNNATPTYDANLGVDTDIAPDPKTKTETFRLGTNFSSPTLLLDDVAVTGLSYSFDYENARLVLLDQFDHGGTKVDSTIAQQLPWINNRLAEPARPPHVIVFGHKNILGTRHRDNLLGGGVVRADLGDGIGLDLASLSPTQQVALVSKRAAMDCFLTNLAVYGVRYYICGHEHLHHDGFVTAPYSGTRVRQLITQAASTNYPVPTSPVSPHLTSIAEETKHVGYYICTVDGPRLTIDYYSAPIETDDKHNNISKTPNLEGKWRKRHTIGYSLNGRDFVVLQGQSYTVVEDTTAKAASQGETGYRGTTARIIDGTNQSKGQTSTGRSLVKAINTGWAPAAGTLSDVLTLWGMNDLGADRTDVYVLAISLPDDVASEEEIRSGKIVLATKNAEGRWTNAVDANAEGETKFVLGPHQSGYALGTHGIDPNTQTAWAVLDYAGQFAAANVAKQ